MPEALSVLPAGILVVFGRFRGYWFYLLALCWGALYWKHVSSAVFRDVHWLQGLLVLVPLLFCTTALRRRNLGIERLADLAFGRRELLQRFFHGVLAAPIVEEVYYRGVLQTAFSLLAGPVGGFAIATVLFPLGHDRSKWLRAGVTGIAIGYAFMETGSLILSIGLHSAVNLVDFIRFAAQLRSLRLAVARETGSRRGRR